MKLLTANVTLFPIQLKAPFKTALREVQSLDVVRVVLIWDNGIIGVGEAAPTPAITGDTQEKIIEDIEQLYVPFLIGKEIADSLEQLTAMKQLVRGRTSAKAAIDIAIFDSLAKQQKQPLFRYLGGTTTTLETDYTISINTPKQMVTDSLAKYQEGFTCLKVKMGLDDPAIEIEKLYAIHHALNEKVQFRIDANQGWQPTEAIQIIEACRELPIQFIEQPVKAHDISGLAYVTKRSLFPIMADESLYDVADAQRLIDEKACDMFNIKLMKAGGIQGAIQIYQLANQHQIPCMIGSMIEGYVGLAAASHFALGMSANFFIDLDVPFMWKPFEHMTEYTGMSFKKNQLTVQNKLGLGVEIGGSL